MEVRLALKGKRGQASIFDALIFLTICAALATALFSATTGYGKNEGEELGFRYLRAYASSVYKAILWAPLDRDAYGCGGGGGGVKDFLLAFTKEKVALASGAGLGEFNNACLRKGYAEALANLTDAVKNNYEYVFVVDHEGGYNLVLLKTGEADAANNDRITFRACTGAGAAVTGLLNQGGIVTAEGLVTLNERGTGNRPYKTLFSMWPSGNLELGAFSTCDSITCSKNALNSYECAHP